MAQMVSKPELNSETMSNNKIYVVEDMAMSRAALISMLTKNDFEVVGSAANADMAWNDIQNLQIDLLILDINLAGKKDGIWLAEQVRKNLNIPIVFLTAYGDDETLNKLAPLNPNGYLLKPYNKPTLITTINIALQSFNALNAKLPEPDKLEVTIESGGKKVKIQLSKLQYVNSDGNYIEIHLEDKSFIIRQKLIDFIDALPENNFMVQIHLRYIVNKNFITTTTSNFVVINDVEIPISKKFKSLVSVL
jgi:DNA-binding LytR/AlgR family response regulator